MTCFLAWLFLFGEHIVSSVIGLWHNLKAGMEWKKSWSVVVVALLFYVHGKHLRSCRDGQLT